MHQHSILLVLLCTKGNELLDYTSQSPLHLSSVSTVSTTLLGKSYEAVSHPVVPTIILSYVLIEHALARILVFAVDLILSVLTKFPQSYSSVTIFEFDLCPHRNHPTLVCKKYCFQGKQYAKSTVFRNEYALICMPHCSGSIDHDL